MIRTSIVRFTLPRPAQSLYSRDDRIAPPDYREIFSINRMTIDPTDPTTLARWGSAFSHRIWPEEIPVAADTWTEYYHAMEKVSPVGALMRLFALALDLDEYWFDDKVDKHMTNLRSATIRISHTNCPRDSCGQARIPTMAR